MGLLPVSAEAFDIFDGSSEPEVLKDRLSNWKKGQNAVFCPL